MILDTIARATKMRIENEKKQLSPEKMEAAARALPCNTGFPFEKALQKQGITYICEIKKASPSKGLIAKDFPYLSIAKEYEHAGAGAISVLTEPQFFLGSDLYLQEIHRVVSVPVLRKDFVLDSYQIFQAKVLGAQAVLLICALLDYAALKAGIRLCSELGLSALVEAHTPPQVKTALKAGARIIGISNRDLQTFKVDLQTCLTLRSLIPKEVLFVAESGVQTPDDINALRRAHVDGILIGETLMRSENKKAALAALNGGPL